MREPALPADRAEPDDAARTELFRDISSTRVPAAITRRISDLIASGQVRPGDRLPSERELCELMGVSRASVREAMRVLEAKDLVTIRVGHGGGTFVTRPSARHAGAGLADLAGLWSVTPSEVMEARQILELKVIELVVERATQPDVDELSAMVSDQDRAWRAGRYDVAMSTAFHVRLAACAGNAAIELLVQSFRGPLLMSLREAQRAAPLMGKRGTTEHRDIVAAISARDIDNARTLMRAHLERTARRIRHGSETTPDPA